MLLVGELSPRHFNEELPSTRSHQETSCPSYFAWQVTDFLKPCCYDLLQRKGPKNLSLQLNGKTNKAVHAERCFDSPSLYFVIFAPWPDLAVVTVVTHFWMSVFNTWENPNYRNKVCCVPVQYTGLNPTLSHFFTHVIWNSHLLLSAQINSRNIIGLNVEKTFP